MKLILLIILLIILAAMPPAAAAITYSALELRFNLPPITWTEWYLFAALGYIGLISFRMAGYGFNSIVNDFFKWADRKNFK